MTERYLSQMVPTNAAAHRIDAPNSETHRPRTALEMAPGLLGVAQEQPLAFADGPTSVKEAQAQAQEPGALIDLTLPEVTVPVLTTKMEEVIDLSSPEPFGRGKRRRPPPGALRMGWMKNSRPPSISEEKRKLRQAVVVAQRAKRAATDAILVKHNTAITAAVAAAAGDRRRFLLAQNPVFRDFLGVGRKATTGRFAGGRKRHFGAATKAEREEAKRREQELWAAEAEEDNRIMESGAEFQPTQLTEQPPNMRGKMRPYQLEGLNFLIASFERNVNAILADEMGLGKTNQAISVLAFLRHYKNIKGPHLVIVPVSTLGNWMKELKMWCPDIHALSFHGTKEARKAQKAELAASGNFEYTIVTSYETVIQETKYLSRTFWRYLIVDEAHRLKSVDTLLPNRLRLITAQSKLLLTGTPLQNNLGELWALLNFLFPDIFGSIDYFYKWFGSVEEMSRQRGSDEESSEGENETVQLLHSLLRPFLLRRLKSEVETSLLPKKETVLFTQLSALQLSLYQAILRKDLFGSGILRDDGAPMKQLQYILMQLRKVANHPYFIAGVEDRTLDPDGEHVVTNSGKLALLNLLLPRLKADGHRVLIFSQFTSILDILEDFCDMRGYETCRLDGNTIQPDREVEIDAFNREGSSKFIFLLSTRAGGLGINLQTADTVILHDSDWNAQVDIQAIDRSHRIGQKRQVNVYRLIAEGTVEERILTRAMSKLKLDNLVIQQGRLTKPKLGAHEVKSGLAALVSFGADKFLRTNTAKLGNMDLDKILERGSKITVDLNHMAEKEVAQISAVEELASVRGPEVEPEEGQYTVFNFRGEDYRTLEASKQSGVSDLGKRKRVKLSHTGQGMEPIDEPESEWRLSKQKDGWKESTVDNDGAYRPN